MAFGASKTSPAHITASAVFSRLEEGSETRLTDGAANEQLNHHFLKASLLLVSQQTS